MTQNTRTYEAMFLVDAGKSDFQAASQPIRNILDRTEAEVMSIKPWDERRLSYEIRGRRRGLYVLTYFKVDPTSASEIERHCDLSEDILRVLILRRDDVSEEQINTKTPAELVADRRAKSDRPGTEREGTGGPPGGEPPAPPPAPPQAEETKVDAADAAGDEQPGDQTPDASKQERA